MAQDDLILTSATALTVSRRFRSHRFSGRFGARNPSLAGTPGVAVTQMGASAGAPTVRVLLPLWQRVSFCPPTPTPRLFFVPKLYGLAVAVLPHLGRPRGGVGGLNGVLGLTDCPAAIARITGVVRGGRRCLLAGGSSSGLLGLPDRGFGDDRGFGIISCWSSVSEDAPGGGLVVVSSDPVASTEVCSGVVDSGASPPFGPPAKIRPSWATDTPATANIRSTRVVRTTARYMDYPRLHL